MGLADARTSIKGSFLKFFSILLLFTFSFLNLKANFFEEYAKHFRGIELHAISTKHIKMFDIGSEVRYDKYIVIHSFHYREDTIYSKQYGLGTSLQRFFLLPKLHLMPFLQILYSISYASAPASEENTSTVSMSSALGGGTYIELSKYIQFGASLNYEINLPFEHKSYFNLLPLFHLKYEFRFD